MGYCEDIEWWKIADTVSVYGYVFAFNYDYLYLVEKSGYFDPHITIEWHKNEVITSKVDTADFSKKCFVRGIMQLSCLETTGCSKLAIHMKILSSDDIYFEE
jgi:hypothetical protein